ncbi:MAG: late competence development ComFB family protein [Candidatus Omnitrophica bacterium]|nr:late competence development ComFB family protein [Candidatus Omnitrophota bacterium]
MPSTLETRLKKPARVTNYMEELAGDLLEDLLDTEYKGPRFSPSNIQDIKALALNRLWPMYATSEAGKSFLRRIVVEDKVEKDVVRELRLAINIVRANPRNQR